jgi:hypothetical protein
LRRRASCREGKSTSPADEAGDEVERSTEQIPQLVAVLSGRDDWSQLLKEPIGNLSNAPLSHRISVDHL